MRLCWVTDIHLNFISESKRDAFFATIEQPAPDIILVGGDIGEAPDVEAQLQAMAQSLAVPIYFVLGNHDFYRGSIRDVRDMARRISRPPSPLRWLPTCGVVPLSATTALLGHDGWADARAGNFAHSSVMLNDYLLIEELFVDKETRIARQRALGDEAAAYLRDLLPGALEKFSHLVVLLHVPPFVAACWHEGRISDDNWLPHFTCVAVGEVLREAMAARPDRRMTVLCGHTHSGGTADILPNLRVLTGPAEYGSPQVQPILTVD